MLLLPGFFMAAGCRVSSEPGVVLLDFESDGELDRLHWKCGTLFSMDAGHAVCGEGALKMELYPSSYPGMSFVPQERDWSSCGKFCFDAVNPSPKALRLTVRIDDLRESPDYPDRYNQSFSLDAGRSTVCVFTEELVTSGTGRRLDLEGIQRVFVFAAGLEERRTVYLDCFRLE